jgi:hypothetical protein
LYLKHYITKIYEYVTDMLNTLYLQAHNSNYTLFDIVNCFKVENKYISFNINSFKYVKIIFLKSGTNLNIWNIVFK